MRDLPAEQDGNTRIKVFDGVQVRALFQNDEWWFSVTDVVRVLTDSTDPRQYIKRIRSRDPELNSNWGTICTPLETTAQDGKRRKENFATTEGVLRLVQSIPSPKAEPFKRWLARVGYERIQEIEKPALAIQRARELYKQKGHNEDWIEKRVRGKLIREELTDEWKNRGIRKGQDYAILTAQISQATFGMKPSEYKRFKGLAKEESLRDNFTDLELIFSMLGEAATKEIAVEKDTQGYDENYKAATEGGAVAGDARKNLEQKTGKMVSSSSTPLSHDTEIIQGQIESDQDIDDDEVPF